MTISDAKPVIEKAERRIATNGIKYRVEFRYSDKAWSTHSTLYNTLEEATACMERMNKSDEELGGEWSIL